MFTFLLAVELIVSILLIIVVLMQSSKGGGLAGTFGGGSVGMVFGVRRTADFLIRATQILATVFIVLSLLINIFFLPRGTAGVESVLQQGATNQATTPVPQLPSQAPVSSPEQGN
ncbi:MAG: preprotein translocase subunit SecG [Ignavibacteriae bacterium]|nr:preprotein translocase subunit SecG [Ignavibacteriota bacterium]